MTKFWKLTASTLALSLGFTSLVACGEKKESGPSGTISGNYQEVTTEQLSSAIANLGSGESEGTQTPATATGFKGDWKMSVGVNADKEGISLKNDGALHIYVDESGEIPSVAAKVTTSVNANITKGMMLSFGVMTDKDASINANAEVFADDEYVYAGVKGEMKGLEGVVSSGVQTTIDAGVKISMGEIFELVMGLMGEYMPVGAVEEEIGGGDEVVPDFDITEILAQAQTLLDISVTADVTTDAVKIKLATGDETAAKVEALLAGLQMEEGGMASMITMIDFTKFDAEVYVSIGKNGELSGFACNADVKMEIPTGTTTKIVGSCSVKMNITQTTETLTLPAGIKTDEKYQLLPLSELM